MAFGPGVLCLLLWAVTGRSSLLTCLSHTEQVKQMLLECVRRCEWNMSKARAGKSCDSSVWKGLVRYSFITSSCLQWRKAVVSSCLQPVSMGLFQRRCMGQEGVVGEFKEFCFFLLQDSSLRMMYWFSSKLLFFFFFKYYKMVELQEAWMHLFMSLISLSALQTDIIFERPQEGPVRDR